MSPYSTGPARSRLQHAVEIANDPGVRSSAELAELYRRIGWASGSTRYETAAAIEIGRQVQGEVQGFRGGALPLALARR
jgi:hypothetical protein